MTQKVLNYKQSADGLEVRRQELAARLHAVRADQSRTREPLSLDWADRATQRENDDVVDAIGSSVQTELSRIEAALHRIEVGTFGRCVSCGAPIEVARLCAIPYAERCSRCVTLDE